MKTANELKAIAIAENDRRNAERHEQVINYLETQVAPVMEEAAAAGFMYVDIVVDAHVDMNLLKEKLTANGYTQSKKGNKLTIYWL